MILAILFGIIIVCGVIMIIVDLDSIFGVIFTLVFGGIILFGLMATFSPRGAEEHVYTSNLGNIADNSTKNLSGFFFLCIGTINSKDETGYAYYRDTGDGYQLRTMGIQDNVYIVEDIEPGEQPYVATHHMTCPGETMGIIMFPLSLWGFSCNASGPNYPEKIVFHVPEGSIINNYSLDAQ